MSPLREWLIAIGTLVIIGIVIDGIRRMRRARKESSAISSGMGANDLKESPLDEDFNPELPSGGARTISRSELDQDRLSRKKPRNLAQSQKPTHPVIAAARSRNPQPLPVQSAADPAFMEVADSVLDSDVNSDVDSVVDNDNSYDHIEAPLSSAEDQWLPEDLSADQEGADVYQDHHFKARDVDDVEELPVPKQSSPTPPPLPLDPSQPLAGANRPPAKEVIVINVLARNGEEFQGPALQRLLEACGLQYGDMDIYHRHETNNTNSPVQFSVASAVEPGTFRPEQIAALSTPGISFFMSLPGPGNALQAFNFMYETAQAVVRNLGGELKDERRSVMTAQTAEHCRQRIREFERKQRSQRN